MVLLTVVTIVSGTGVHLRVILQWVMSLKIILLTLPPLVPVASFTKEVNLRLAKSPLKTKGCLANRGLTSLVKEATGVNELNKM